MVISRRKKKLSLIIAGALLFCLLFLGLWAFVIEPDSLVVNETPLTLHHWPAPFNNLRIVLISDLHVGSPYIDGEKLQHLVSMINSLNPDLILIAGDFVIDGVLGGRFVEPEVIADNLKNLHARDGVFAVLGNHDWWHNGGRVRRALEGVGIRVLENDVIRLERDGQSFWLAGFADFWTRKQDIEGTIRKVSDEGPIIALTHSPDIFPHVPTRVALTLAGHTHGGQVSLPFIGRRIVPSAYGQRYAAGHIQESGHHLFVTPGIGTSIIPVRFRVPPEISVLIIKSSQ